MIQRRILFFVVMMFTVVFAYGGRKDKAWAKSVNEGLALFAQEKYEAAIEKFDEALRIVPLKRGMLYNRKYIALIS